jgi:predicted Zn-dependent peptidase
MSAANSTPRPRPKQLPITPGAPGQCAAGDRYPARHPDQFGLRRSELTREKHVILQEIGAANDTPDDVVYDKFTEAAYRDQTIGRPILGTPETVKAFTPEQVRAYLARHYTGDRIVVVAAGAVDHDTFVKLIDDSFGKTIKPTGKLLRTIPTASYTGGDYRESAT